MTDNSEELPTPSFYYFDLGNVLLLFDHEQAVQGIERELGIPADAAREVLIDGGLQAAYERGDVTSQEFAARFARAVGKSTPVA